MQKLKGVCLTGTLDELSKYAAPDDTWRFKDTIIPSFEGTSPEGEYRIPAADTGHELFFNSSDVLRCFTAMPKPSQQTFLTAVRGAMEKHGTNVIVLKVRWSPLDEEDGILKIEKINEEGCLNIYV